MEMKKPDNADTPACLHCQVISLVEEAALSGMSGGEVLGRIVDAIGEIIAYCPNASARREMIAFVRDEIEGATQRKLARLKEHGEPSAEIQRLH